MDTLRVVVRPAIASVVPGEDGEELHGAKAVSAFTSTGNDGGRTWVFAFECKHFVPPGVFCPRLGDMENTTPAKEVDATGKPCYGIRLLNHFGNKVWNLLACMPTWPSGYTGNTYIGR
jgi:hypothetical protein